MTTRLTSRRSFLQSALLLPAVPSLLAQTVTSARAESRALPASVSLQADYLRYGLAAQAQQGDTCWAYSIVGCLELEMARAGRGAAALSGPYLVWAGATAAGDVIDRRGSNFARAAAALERFGICEEALLPTLNTAAPESTPVSDAARQRGLTCGRDICIDWLRFWRTPPGLTADEMRAVKTRIAEGHPVAVGMRWPRALTVENKELCLLGACHSEDETFDGHCVVLVGYEDNDRFEGGGAFLIRNSWGKDWMDRGFARLSYAHLQCFANDVVSFAIDSKSPHRLLPRASAPSNLSAIPGHDLRAADCVADRGVSLQDADMSGFRKGVWQNDNQIFCRADADGHGFNVPFKVATSGNYQIVIAGTKAPDYGIWAILVDGVPLGLPCDFSWPAVAPTGEIALGQLDLSAGVHTLRFQRTGKSIASTGYLFGLDWFRVQSASA